MQHTGFKLCLSYVRELLHWVLISDHRFTDTDHGTAMPLYTADHGSIGAHALLTVPEKYLIFYSSPVHGEMWCPVLCALLHQLFVD
jgi:hypothetical protein